MLNAIKWFTINFENRLDKKTYRNITIFPIVWNLYESNWWNTQFKIHKLENHIETSLLPKITMDKSSQDSIESLHERLLMYREIRGYSILNHFNSLSAGNTSDFIEVFTNKSNLKQLDSKLWILIWTAYRVRCNMFHGSKDLLDYHEIMEQRILFEVLNDLLILLIDMKSIKNV